MDRLVAFFVVIFISFTSGCATSRVTSQEGRAGGMIEIMYPISAKVADRLMVDSMSEQFPGAPIMTVKAPYEGYFVNRRFLLDSQDFTIRMIPKKGRGESGEVVDGFVFEVIDEGTMLVSGPVRGASLFKKVCEKAGRLAKPVPVIY